MGFVSCVCVNGLVGAWGVRALPMSVMIACVFFTFRLAGMVDGVVDGVVGGVVDVIRVAVFGQVHRLSVP